MIAADGLMVMRGRLLGVGVALAAAVVVLALVAGRASAHVSGYGLPATKPCLVHNGAVLGSTSTDPAASELSGAERLRLISAVISSPSATGPLFLYVAFGNDVAQARSIISRVGKHLLQPPTAANSVAGEKLNAVWLIESSVGARPPASATSVVASCLRTGPAAAAPTPLTLETFSSCVSAHGGYTLDKKVVGWLFPQLPSSIVSRMAAAIVPGNVNDQGVSAFLLIGRDRQDSTALRDRVAALLRDSASGQTMGTAGQAAWLSIPTRRATATAVKQARKTLEFCLS